VNTLLLGIAGAGKTRDCVRRAAAALAGGGSILYLVPNRDEAALLRRRLVEAGGGRAALLPGIETLPGLVRGLFGRIRPGASLRGPLSRRLAIQRQLLERKGFLGTLEDSAATPGFAHVLDGLFTELLEGEMLPDDLEILGAERPGILARLYRDYIDGQGSCLDPPLAMRSVTEALEQGVLKPPPADLLVADGFSNLSPLQLRFFDALVSGAAESIFSLCIQPADLEGPPRPPFERLHRLATHFAEREGWRTRSIESSARFADAGFGRLASGLFREEGDEALAGLELLAAATPRDEVEGIAGELRRALASGLPASRAAVLFRDAAYGELLAEALDAAAVPYRIARKEILARLPAAAVLLALLDWASGIPLADLPQRLRGGFVGGEDALFAAMQAEGRARGIRRAKQWDGLFDEFRRRFPKADWGWFDWKPSRRWNSCDPDQWRDKLVEPILEWAASRLAARAVPEGWSAFSEDMRELEAIRACVAQLAAEAFPDRSRRPVGEWQAALRRGLEDSEIRWNSGLEGGGVLLGNPFETRLPELDTVFVCGLGRGGFPPPFRDHPLLRESERRELNRSLAEAGRRGLLSTWEDRQAEERYLFYVAVTRASRRLVLSYSLRDRQGRTRPRSVFLDELARLAKLPEPRSLPALSLEARLARPSRPRDLLRDSLLARGRGGPAGLRESAEKLLRVHGFAEALDAASAGSRPRRLSGHPALGAHLANLATLSATALESYSRCPFRYLMQDLLGLRDDEDFEPGLREEGKLEHKILEMFYREWTDPVDGAPLRKRLSELMERASSLLSGSSGMAAILNPRFRAENPRRLRKLQLFIERDQRRIASTGFRPDPEALELRFELDGSELPVPGKGFSLKGFIDRVDRDAKGRELVLDYKRSGKNSEPPELAPPTLFQLPLYALGRKGAVAGAAYCSLKHPKPFRGYFRSELKPLLADWAVRVDGKNRKGGHFLGEDEWELWLRKVSARILELVALIGEGRMDPAPIEGESTCDKCELTRLCSWADDAKGGIHAAE